MFPFLYKPHGWFENWERSEWLPGQSWTDNYMAEHNHWWRAQSTKGFLGRMKWGGSVATAQQCRQTQTMRGFATVVATRGSHSLPPGLSQKMSRVWSTRIESQQMVTHWALFSIFWERADPLSFRNHHHSAFRNRWLSSAFLFKILIFASFISSDTFRSTLEYVSKISNSVYDFKAAVQVQQLEMRPHCSVSDPDHSEPSSVPNAVFSSQYHCMFAKRQKVK